MSLLTHVPSNPPLLLPTLLYSSHPPLPPLTHSSTSTPSIHLPSYLRLDFLGIPVRVAITQNASCRDAHALVGKICAPYVDPITVTTGGGGDATGGGGDATGGAGGDWDDYTLLVTNLYGYDVKREVPKNSDELLNLAWCEVLFVAWNTEGGCPPSGLWLCMYPLIDFSFLCSFFSLCLVGSL